MNDRFAADVRRALGARHVASPGLEARVLERLHAQAPRPRSSWLPAFVAAVLGVAVVVPLAWIAIGAQILNLLPAGLGGRPTEALSLGAVAPDGSLWLVERQVIQAPPNPTRNVLFERDASGWHERLRFTGVFGQFAISGSNAVLITGDLPPSGRPRGRPWQLTHVYRSADGGRTWARTLAPPSAEGVHLQIFFDGPLSGWALVPAESGLFSQVDLFETTDAGQTWVRAGTFPSIAPPAGTRSFTLGPSSFHIDPATGQGWTTLGYIATDQHSGLYTTADGGRTWTEVVVSRPDVMTGYDMVVLEPHRFGSRYFVPITFRRDGGADNATPNVLYVTDGADLGHLASARPMFPGKQRVEPVGDQLWLEMLDAQHWWVTSTSYSAGNNVQAAPALAETSDGGAHWTVYQPAPKILFTDFRDAKNGYALAVEGLQNTNVLLQTTDGGDHWTHVALPSFPAS